MGGSGPGSESCCGSIGEQTVMQPNRVSKFVMKVWMTVWCLVVLGVGRGGSWDEFKGVYGFHDRTLLKDIAHVTAYEVPPRYSGRQIKSEILKRLLEQIKGWATASAKKRYDMAIWHRIEGRAIRNIWRISC